MILEIGIGILSFGIGLFVGNWFGGKSKPQNEEDKNALSQWIDNKLEEKKMTKMLQKEARVEAMQELKPRMKEIIKEKELKKLTGEDRKEKLQKFANAFSMKGSGIGSTEKINQMLNLNNGIQPQQPQQPNYRDYQKRRIPSQDIKRKTDQRKDSGFDIENKLKQMLG